MKKTIILFIFILIINLFITSSCEKKVEEIINIPLSDLEKEIIGTWVDKHRIAALIFFEDRNYIELFLNKDSSKISIRRGTWYMDNDIMYFNLTAFNFEVKTDKKDIAEIINNKDDNTKIISLEDKDKLRKLGYHYMNDKKLKKVGKFDFTSDVIKKSNAVYTKLR